MIGCPVSQDELFNELGCGGGAILFIDNIDQIDDAGEWATVTDLLSGVARCPGWRAVVTGGIGNDDWKTKLPAEVRRGGIATLHVDELTDDETETLSQENHALAILLGNDHPARGIARNLFYLSRMVELGASQGGAAAAIATEMDLARLWWRYGGGRSEDVGRLARLKVLRAMGAQFVANPSRVSFKADDFDSSTVAQLLRFDSLREDIKGATVAFRHDVLRDWTVGFLIHEDNDVLKTLPLNKLLAPSLARGIEIAARLAIENDPTGARWLDYSPPSNVMAATEAGGAQSCSHCRAPIKLALFESLKSVLLANHGRLLSEIIRLMISVESVPVAKLVERVQPLVQVPAGVSDMIVPKGTGWMWLVLWLVSAAQSLPTALIPDVSKVFQAWLISAPNQSFGVNTPVVGFLFEWLAVIEKRMSSRFFRDPQDAPPNLNIRHPRDVRDEIRMTAFAFAHLNPVAAQSYLSGLNQEEVAYNDTEDILRAPGALARAVSTALVDFMLGALIEKEDLDALYDNRRSRYGPFSVHDYLFSPASPGQGPFFDLLESAPAEGLRLIRAIVEHATQWRREQYIEGRQSFPRVSIPFPSGTKSFEGDWSVYHWVRSIVPSVTTASALMALEAWGHLQIEAGRPFEEVLHDVLGHDGSSLAFVCVAVDLTLSHWREACDFVWPMIATPELLVFDDARMLRDMVGVDRIASFEQEPSTWRVKRAELDAKPSRRNRLSDKIGHYVFHGKPHQLQRLRAALEQARNEIKHKPNDGEDPINGLVATAERAVRMTDAQHWPLVKVRLRDGSEAEVHQFQRDPKEQRLLNEKATRAQANLRHQNVRMKMRAALLDRTKSTARLVAEGIEWAKAQTVTAEPPLAEENEDKDYNKEWDGRAVVTAAALAARDNEGADRNEIIAWALPILNTAAAGKDKEHPGNDQIEHNATAIATLGSLALYLDQEAPHLDSLLRLAAHQHLSVVNALGRHFPELAQFDPRIPRSIIRIIMTASINPYRADSNRQNKINRQTRQDRVSASITAERNWLEGTRCEPDWPELPPWRSRPRRGIRLPGWTEEDDDEFEEERPDQYVDEHALGAVANYLIPFTVGELPAWVVALAVHLMHWAY
jgi:hypothetical protein